MALCKFLSCSHPPAWKPPHHHAKISPTMPAAPLTNPFEAMLSTACCPPACCPPNLTNAKNTLSLLHHSCGETTTSQLPPKIQIQAARGTPSVSLCSQSLRGGGGRQNMSKHAKKEHFPNIGLLLPRLLLGRAPCAANKKHRKNPKNRTKSGHPNRGL